jgi:hypothetical protein
MAVRLSDSQAGRALLYRNIYISVSGTHFGQKLNKLQGQVRPEGLGKSKISIDPSGLEPATFRIEV